MGEVAYDPNAPGAAAASQTDGPVCGARYMHGGVAGELGLRGVPWPV